LNDPTNEHVVAQRRFHDTQPAVSPDGQWIAFVAQSDGNSEIYLTKIDGSGLVRLTRNAGEDMSPVFSADGGSLIFGSDRSGRFAIYKIDLHL
jgi:Tol biopolymer transport system component